MYIRVHDRLSEKRNEGSAERDKSGAIAQLGERLPCTQEVVGSIPSGSTILSVVLLLLKVFK